MSWTVGVTIHLIVCSWMLRILQWCCQVLKSLNRLYFGGYEQFTSFRTVFVLNLWSALHKACATRFMHLNRWRFLKNTLFEIFVSVSFFEVVAVPSITVSHLCSFFWMLHHNAFCGFAFLKLSTHFSQSQKKKYIPQKCMPYWRNWVAIIWCHVWWISLFS